MGVAGRKLLVTLPGGLTYELQVCRCGPGGQKMLIDCCTAGSKQQRRGAGERWQLSAYVGSILGSTLAVVVAGI